MVTVIFHESNSIFVYKFVGESRCQIKFKFFTFWDFIILPSHFPKKWSVSVNHIQFSWRNWMKIHDVKSSYVDKFLILTFFSIVIVTLWSFSPDDYDFSWILPNFSIRVASKLMVLNSVQFSILSEFSNFQIFIKFLSMSLNFSKVTTIFHEFCWNFLYEFSENSWHQMKLSFHYADWWLTGRFWI